MTRIIFQLKGESSQLQCESLWRHCERLGRRVSLYWPRVSFHNSRARSMVPELSSKSARAYPDTCLSLLELRVWRWETRIHEAKVGGFHYSHAIYTLLNQQNCIVQILLNLFFFRLKINHTTGCNSSAFLLVLGVDETINFRDRKVLLQGLHRHWPCCTLDRGAVEGIA